MNRIRIAQIGTSKYSHGNMIWTSLKKQSDIFEIVGYAMPENEETKFPNAMREFEGYPKMTVDEILKDPTITAVAIETEEIYLSKYALLAAKANKHIHMEKPGGTEPSDFEELIRTVKKTGKVFHTGYMYRYNPYILDLLDRIKAGKLGRILSVEAQMNCYHTPEVRQWLKQFPGGMMFFLGCHLVDLILQIQGQPKRIIPLNKSTNCDTEAEDFGMAVFEYENGISFAKTSALEIGGYARRQLVVVGTNGTVELKPLEISAPGVGLCTKKTEYWEKSWGCTGEHSQTEFDRYDGMTAGFASYIRGERENPYTPDYELELYKTIRKACGESL